MPKKRSNIEPGTRFNNWTVIKEVPKPEHLSKNTRRNRYFLVQCDCGFTAVRRLDTIKQVVSCIECSKKYDYIYKQFPDYPREVQKSTPWIAWCNFMQRQKDRGIPVCAEWRDFGLFLPDYLEMSGTSLEDHLGPRMQWTYFHLERKNKELPWTKDNTFVTRFVTERARDKETYRYWNELLQKELLSDEIKSYKDFVNAFGVKQSGYRLRRKDKTILHSIDNSEWTLVKRTLTNST
jgi:hypothetical protein